MLKMPSWRTLLLPAILTALSANAATLSSISFVSNGGGFVNNTIVDGASPLAFIAATSTSNPFLNNANSTIALGYGTYYAIAFLGFGQHLGTGQVSFILDAEVSPRSQNVTFPANSPAGVTFATLNLPGGDTVRISTTGITGVDRIRIVADGGGLSTDGTADAFYLFEYQAAGAVPEPSTLAGTLLGLTAVVWRYRRK